ncbi:MAG: c-type cytochrome [Bdellovibrionota bacterium]
MKYFVTIIFAYFVSSTIFAKGDAKKGKELYEQTCVGCHQKDGLGYPGLGPRLNTPDLLFLANDEFFKKTILEGRPGTGMISYKILPNIAKGVDDIVAYFRSWETSYPNYKRQKVNWNKKIKGNINKGKVSFRSYCSSCHGPNGGGYADGGSGLAIGLSGFLKAASDDFIKKTIETGRAGTAMKPFGHGRGLANISENEINDIISYLRSLE